MKIVIYVSTLGKLAVTYDLFLPSVELEKLYGAMERCGDRTLDDGINMAVWNRVVTDIDALTYALITFSEGEHLLGVEAPCFKRVKQLLLDAPAES